MLLFIALRYCKKCLWLGLKVGVGLATQNIFFNAMLLLKW